MDSARAATEAGQHRRWRVAVLVVAVLAVGYASGAVLGWPFEDAVPQTKLELLCGALAQLPPAYGDKLAAEGPDIDDPDGQVHLLSTVPYLTQAAARAADDDRLYETGMRLEQSSRRNDFAGMFEQMDTLRDRC